MNLIKADEYLHPPGKQQKWRESYYFNWADLENKVSGFSTIGILPKEKRRELVFVLFLEDGNEIYYKELYLEHYENDVVTMLKDKRLSYSLKKPFESWDINYKSRKLNLKIDFKTRFPTYYFGKKSSASWHQHFEASGVIKGVIIFKDGTKINVDGFGQRDKSWGLRDWHQFEKWYAAHFQFKNWSCTFRKDYINGNINLSGCISKNNKNIPLKSLEINTINDKDTFYSPISTIYELEDINDCIYKIKAERINKNSFIRFVRQFSEGYTELFEQMVIMTNMDTAEIGSGMMEHLRTKKSKLEKN